MMALSMVAQMVVRMELQQAASMVDSLAVLLVAPKVVLKDRKKETPLAVPMVGQTAVL